MAETTLYERDGTPTMYVDDDGSIYTWRGRAVAHLNGQEVYAWMGRHLGWFVDGVMYDILGRRAGFTVETCPAVTRVERVKNVQQVPRVRGVQHVPRVRPVLSTIASEQALEEMLASGE